MAVRVDEGWEVTPDGTECRITGHTVRTVSVGVGDKDLSSMSNEKAEEGMTCGK